MDPVLQCQGRIEALLPNIKQLLDVGGTVGATVGVTIGDRVAIKHEWGLRDVSQNLPITSTTLFPVGSLTKTFTSALCAKYVNDGLLSWTTPIAHYLPELSGNPYGEETTILDILSHRSGLTRKEGLILGAYNECLIAKEDVVEFVGKIGRVCPPRSGYFYTDLGYGIVGEIIERVSGRTYGRALEDAILKPLGLNSTTNFRERIPNGMQAKGYVAIGDGPAQPIQGPRMFDREALTSSAGLRTCLDDLFAVDSASHVLRQSFGQVCQSCRILRRSCRLLCRWC